MALKSTIFKFVVEIADLDRSYYQTHTLTLARHPSETDERMTVRLVAFILNAHEALEFGKGISTEDEPDLWQRNLTGELEKWIEVGLPDEKRLRKASGRAREVILFSYGGRNAELWWSHNQPALQKLEKLKVFDLPAEQTQALARTITRTMQVNATMQEETLWLNIGEHSLQLTPQRRQ